MKLSIIAAALISAVFVQADVYHFEFESATVSENCLAKNFKYINKVSSEFYCDEQNLFMTLKNGCNPVIADNINAVCGGVVSSECS
jgi:hypothetical protein